MIDDSDEARDLSDQTLDHVPHAEVDAAARKRREEKRARAALVQKPVQDPAERPHVPTYKWMSFWVTIGVALGLLLLILLRNALKALSSYFELGG